MFISLIFILLLVFFKSYLKSYFYSNLYCSLNPNFEPYLHLMVYTKKYDFGNVMPKAIPNFVKSTKIFGDELLKSIKKLVLFYGKLSLTLKFNL